MPGKYIMQKVVKLQEKFLVNFIIIFFIFTSAECQEFRWGETKPEDAGFSSEKLLALRDTLASHNTTSILIIRDDKIVLEWYAPGWDKNKLHYTASLAKALVGGMSLVLAMDDGRMKADDPAWMYVPEWKGDPLKSRITIRHLATHSSGIEDPELSEKEIEEYRSRGIEIKDKHMDIPGWKGDFWRRYPDPFSVSRDSAPVIFPPGTYWHYSNTGMAMLSYAITSGYKGTEYKDIRSLLRQRIMIPIGIRDDEWNIGYNNTYMVDGLELVANWGGGNFTPRAVARIGRLMMNKGNWEGQQLISHSLAELVVKYAGTPLPPRNEKDLAPASGLAWYTNFDGVWPDAPRDLFSGAGAGNQTLIVIPSLKIIVVRNGGDMFDPQKGEGFNYGIYNLLVHPLMEAFSEPPYPMSNLISEVKFAPEAAIVRRALGSDNWPVTWGDDDNLYTAYGDGWGFEPKVQKKLSLGLARVTGNPEDPEGINIRSATGEFYGDGRAGKKASGMLMVDGILYMWLRNANGDGEESQIGWSADHGITWNYTDWKLTTGFGYPVFLNFGKNYKGARDKYVYIYSHDEKDAYKPADRMNLARVRINRIRDQDSYEFFNTTNEQGNPVWTNDIEKRGAVFNNPAKCYRSGISYNEGLKRYLWCQILPASNHPQGSRFRGGFGIYEAPEPWGPWSTVFFTDEWDVGPGETASFPTKWISRDGKTCYLLFSGDDSFSVRKVELITK